MPNPLIRSTPLRLTLLLGAVFLLSLGIAAGLAFVNVRQELAARTDQSVADTYAIIAKSYGDNDINDLTESVASHASELIDDDHVYLLQDLAGARLAGNVPAISARDGWSTLSAAAVNDAEATSDYRVYSGVVGNYRLTVGMSLSEADEIAELMLTSLMWAGAALVLLITATGIAVAVRGQRRLDAVSAAMAEIGRGRLEARIPLSRLGDDIDRLSGDMNVALERLEMLVDGMRQVSVDIAHELKTPLNRLGIAIEAAIEASDRREPVDPLLEQAQAEGRTINSTFDALLRIAQIESGARRARFTELNVLPILDNIADAYAAVAAENQQFLSYDAPPSVPIVHGDADLLTQLLANLVENAIRHCAPGATIRLKAETVGAGLVLTVTDTGPGIPEAEREKVFRRLYRLEKSRTTPGSGLGLALVKAIAELHGAQISLSDNEPGLAVRIVFPMNNGVGVGG